MTGRTDFEKAVSAGIITGEQARQLTAFFATTTPPVPPVAAPARSGPVFDLAHVLWYAGALIVIGAMGLFSTLAFSQMGAPALLVTSAVYMMAFWLVGGHLWDARGLTTPGGLLIAVAVSMVPLLVFSVQDMAGWWDKAGKPGAVRDFYIWIKGGWLPMEVATIGAALFAIRRYPFGFIAMLAALSLWFMSMDLADWLIPKGQHGWKDTWEMQRKVSMWFGLALLPFAWWTDLKQQRADYAFWLHMAAIMAFWGGLTAQHSDSELAKFAYCMINVALVGLSVFLSRRVYAVFGTMGVVGYLGYLAEKVFKDSLLFPFALSALGIAVIALGLWYFRHREAINARMEQWIPAALAGLRPPHAHG